MTDIDKVMDPQHFWSDLADMRIQVRINLEIRIRIPDDVRLRLDALAMVCAVSAQPSFISTIRYDSGYLTCSKKLTGSQLSLPHGTNQKLECDTKNKMISIIGPVQ